MSNEKNSKSSKEYEYHISLEIHENILYILSDFQKSFSKSNETYTKDTLRVTHYIYTYTSYQLLTFYWTYCKSFIYGFHITCLYTYRAHREKEKCDNE